MREHESGEVVAAAWAWLKARQDDPQTIGVGINESGAAVIHALLARPVGSIEALRRIDEYITRYAVPPHDANMPNEHHCQYATMVQSIHGTVQKALRAHSPEEQMSDV